MESLSASRRPRFWRPVTGLDVLDGMPGVLPTGKLCRSERDCARGSGCEHG